MTFEGVLKNLFTTGRDDDTIAYIRCSPLFSMRGVVVTRETLWRSCGYGASPVDRYLDDLVNIIINTFIFYIHNSNAVIETNESDVHTIIIFRE